MKSKRLILISFPILILLILVIIKTLNKDHFNLNSNQSHELSLAQNHILSPPKLREMLKSSRKIMLIDIRNKNDFEKAHLDNALNIPMPEILENPQLNALQSTENELVLYSNSTSESAKAWILLTQKGFKKIYLLDIDSDFISQDLFEKDSIVGGDEILKYKFQPDSLTRPE